MTKKTIVILIAITIILSIFAIISFYYTKNDTTDITPSPTPYVLFPDNAQEVISNTTEDTYRIMLTGNELSLVYNENIIHKTQIAPDVLPKADVDALKDGIEYLNIEEALIDWESLSN